MQISISKTIKNPKKSFEEIEILLRDELAKEGFGILTEIDVKATLKKKLDLDKRPYKILGACNPPRANQALEFNPEIGTLLPCNVVLYENKDSSITISAMNPESILTLVPGEEVKVLAQEVRTILEEVIIRVFEKLQ